MPYQSSDKKFSCFQMERMVMSLQPLLESTDVVGYVAARNVRILDSELEDYYNLKNKLIGELGTRDVDEFGNELSTSSIKVGTPEFDKFMEKITPVGQVESSPKLFILKAEECCGCMSGKQMIDLSWMVDFSDEGGDDD